IAVSGGTGDRASELPEPQLCHPGFERETLCVQPMAQLHLELMTNEATRVAARIAQLRGHPRVAGRREPESTIGDEGRQRLERPYVDLSTRGEQIAACG